MNIYITWSISWWNSHFTVHTHMQFHVFQTFWQTSLHHDGILILEFILTCNFMCSKHFGTKQDSKFKVTIPTWNSHFPTHTHMSFHVFPHWIYINDLHFVIYNNLGAKIFWHTPSLHHHEIHVFLSQKLNNFIMEFTLVPKCFGTH